MIQVSEHANAIFSSVCYRISEALVDPGDRWAGFEGVRGVLLSHGHFDHIYGLNEVLRLNPDVKVYVNSSGREMLMDSKKNLSYYHGTPFVFDCPDAICVVEDGAEIRIGDCCARAVYTPGHHPSCVTWIIGDCVFSGDSYIPGTKVVTNLPGGSRGEALRSVEVVRGLGAQGRIFPGHRVSH